MTAYEEGMISVDNAMSGITTGNGEVMATRKHATLLTS
jgi:hypothetical protein